MAGQDSIRLNENIERIMDLWTERSLKEVPSAISADALALRDSLPIYLNHLSEALATDRRMDTKSVLAHDNESARIGSLHGADRAGNSSYVLTEVIFECHILREVIFQVLEREGPLGSLQRDIILDSIEQAVNDAAVKFSEVHADIQQKFLDTLTHDLKNPVTAAKIAAQLILRRPESVENCLRSASSINNSLARLERMIHDLLDASRVRAGESLSLPLSRCDLDSIVREVVDQMSITYGARFVLNSTDSLECECNGDGIRRALENLISNAVKYGAEGAPIAISLKRVSDHVEISVHNFGSVIPEHEIPVLLRHFGRAKSAHEGTKTGWGLGLTLVKGVVDAHKGKLRVESSLEKGTTFIIELSCTGSSS